MGFFQKIVNFHKDLINTETPTSSRRYLAIVFAYFILMAGSLNQFFKLDIKESMFYTIATMALVYAGLATWSGIAASSSKSDVASDVAKSNSSPDTNKVAKEIVESIKDSK